MTAPRRALAVLLAMSCGLSAPSLLFAQAPAAPSIAASKFWNGKEGAECMADVLRSRAPQFVYRTRTFQDFDVVSPVVEIGSDGRLSRLIVISASEYMLRSTSYPFLGFEPVLSGQHRYYYDLGSYYHLGSRYVPPSVVDVVLGAREEWEQTCGSFQAPIHRWGVCSCNLSPEDFKITGELDLQSLLPLLTPAPLTPIDIR